MKISNKTRHAIKILTSLLENGESSVNSLSKKLDVSNRNIGEACRDLKKFGILKSIPDAPGHYQLVSHINVYNLWHIIEYFNDNTWELEHSILDVPMVTMIQTAKDIKVNEFANRLKNSSFISSEKSTAVDLLSKKEKEILVAVAKGMTTQEIAEALGLSHHTVNRHRNSIRKKMGFNTAACYARFAIKHGLIEV